MKIISPLFITIPRKTKKDRKVYINLNTYRNLHYLVEGMSKKIYCELMVEQLKGVVLHPPIEITFTLFKGSNRKIDRSNILSITEKYFCDALVHYGAIPDDNDLFIKATHYKTGGIDPKNGRVEIIIKETKL